VRVINNGNHPFLKKLGITPADRTDYVQGGVVAAHAEDTVGDDDDPLGLSQILLQEAFQPGGVHVS
jgi:hypothetical protein